MGKKISISQLSAAVMGEIEKSMVYCVVDIESPGRKD